MKHATIVDLRNHLSSYLRRVERGERVLIRRRTEVVAELHQPLPYAESDARQALIEDKALELARRGVLRRGTGKWPAWVSRPIVGPAVPLLKALLHEREHNR